METWESHVVTGDLKTGGGLGKTGTAFSWAFCPQLPEVLADFLIYQPDDWAWGLDSVCVKIPQSIFITHGNLSVQMLPAPKSMFLFSVPSAPV